MNKGYKVISDGTDNHLMLIDLRTKFPEISGKKVENTLVLSHITVNKNMVPFDSSSPFLTSGLRVGTPAITTRGLKEEHMGIIVDLIDEVISDIENEAVIKRVGDKVIDMMKVISSVFNVDSFYYFFSISLYPGNPVLPVQDNIGRFLRGYRTLLSVRGSNPIAGLSRQAGLVLI